MKLPLLIGIGPQRTGSTWLYEQLKRIVDLPHGIKEPQFFDRHFSKGISWYAAHFDPGSSLPAGEIGPTYFHDCAAAKRIKQTLPHCRIFATLRNPVDRIYSLYNLLGQYGLEHRSLKDAFRSHPTIVESSKYATHVARWQMLFPEDFKVFLYDELKRSPQNYLDSICDFADLPRVRVLAEIQPEVLRPARFWPLARTGFYLGNAFRSWRCYKIVNIAKKVGIKDVFFFFRKELAAPDEALNRQIREFVQVEILRLEEILRIDLSHWRNAP